MVDLLKYNGKLNTSYDKIYKCMVALGIYKFVIYNKDKKRFELTFVPDNSFKCGLKLTAPIFKLIMRLGRKNYMKYN